MRRRLRRLLLLGIALLYGVSIPWYRRGGAEPEVWLGLPDWVAVALLCYAGVAVLNAAAWLLTDVPEARPGDAARAAARSGAAASTETRR
ncbi:MAG: hypothetical protein R3263_03700 [Myxococcota bacterium]|nr:hypothetical protein [Myxococcota bacterium]